MPIKETDFPCYYIDSNNASIKAQNAYKRIVWSSIILMLISTIMVSIDTSLTHRFSHYDKINALILFFSGFISLFLAYSKPEKKWYLGRAIAESMKTLSWRYMMKAAPFEFDDDKEDLKNFIKRIEEINKQANKDKFIPKPNKIHLDIITEKMSEVRSLSYDERKSFYSKNRLENQIQWYGNKSELNRKKANLCSALIIGCQFIAAIYLFEFFDKIKVLNVNNIMVFVATSLISIVELNKYKELHQAYAFTKQELNIIRTKFKLINNDNDFSEFVFEAEQAISREHTTWLARRG